MTRPTLEQLETDPDLRSQWVRFQVHVIQTRLRAREREEEAEEWDCLAAVYRRAS